MRGFTRTPNVFTRSHQIPQCFLFLIRYPNDREFTGTIQPAQIPGIASIRFDAVAWPLRYQ